MRPSCEKTKKPTLRPAGSELTNYMNHKSTDLCVSKEEKPTVDFINSVIHTNILYKDNKKLSNLSKLRAVINFSFRDGQNNLSFLIIKSSN